MRKALQIFTAYHVQFLHQGCLERQVFLVKDKCLAKGCFGSSPETE